MDSRKILILNGPNLNLLGVREPHVYGSRTMDELLSEARGLFPDVEIGYYQSNHEGDLIDRIHAVGFDRSYLGIVFNEAKSLWA